MQLDHNVFLQVHPRQFMCARALVDQRQVESNFSLQVINAEGVILGVHDWLQRERLLVVVEGCRQEPQLVHGAAQVVEGLLAVAPELQILVEKGAGLQRDAGRR